MYSISNNDDVFGIRDLNSLINATSNKKQFHLSSNIYDMIDSFGNNILTLTNIQY